ncbi:MAG: YjbQ family protein, partial [Archaeoglobi archaeon]|nr:YjbQ family protein [Candidatus Mnemosynella sp.]
MKVLRINTEKRIQIIDITPEVQKVVEDSGIESGICLVHSLHTTTALILNENEPRLIEDLRNHLERLVPQRGSYSHNEIDSNADSHLRAILLNSSLSLPVSDRKLFLGTWQRILFVELDGP